MTIRGAGVGPSAGRESSKLSSAVHWFVGRDQVDDPLKELLRPKSPEVDQLALFRSAATGDPRAIQMAKVASRTGRQTKTVSGNQVSHPDAREGILLYLGPSDLEIEHTPRSKLHTAPKTLFL